MSTLQDLLSSGAPITKDTFKHYTLEDLEKLANEVLETRSQIKQVQQLELAEVVNPKAIGIHMATTKEVLAVGGNRSSKTDSNLLDLVISMTGIIPYSLKDVYPKEKIHCPGRYRLVCESLTNTWAPVIRPKLQWWVWNGRGKPGGQFGHWGWIPQRFLKRGKWEDSWSEKERTLTLTCGCTLQIMSYDQETQDQSGTSLHRVIFDEAPDASMYRENLIRTMDTGGQVYSGFTPPDEVGRAMRGSWIYSLFEKGLDGPEKDPGVTSINLFTEENKILDAKSIEEVSKGLSPEQREVRLHGAFIHLSGRIYPLFTNTARNYCFTCNSVVILNNGKCVTCEQQNVTSFNHVIEPFEAAYRWPVAFFIDPHPRKPNMCMWVAIDPADDWYVLNEMEVDGDPATVRDRVLAWEHNLHIDVVARYIDPRMAGSPAHSAGKRHITVRSEFDAVGLRCALASDSFEVGHKRVREMLKPDPRSKSPRLLVFNHCRHFIKQMREYVWSEWGGKGDLTHDVKGIPVDKENDYPRMLDYLANANLRFSTLRQGLSPMQGTRKKRTGSYG